MQNKNTKIFSSNLNRLMSANGKEQIDLINDLGINKSTISTWCRGEKMPRMGTIQSLANYFGVNISDLVDENEVNSFIIVDMKLYPTPVFENVSAGFGTAAIDYIVDYVALPFSTKSEADATICIRVKGDSMSPKIMDGDLIQVQKQSSVDSGDIAVVLLDGDEGFVKKVEYGKDFIKLISLNPGYEPILLQGASVQRCSVVGKVKKVIRDI